MARAPNILSESLLEPFIRRDLGPKQCWLWHGSKDKEGHGRVISQGKMWPIKLAIIQVYRPTLLLNTSVPHSATTGAWDSRKAALTTTCGNRFCVNPQHIAIRQRVKKPFKTRRNRAGFDVIIPPEQTAEELEQVKVLRRIESLQNRLRQIYTPHLLPVYVQPHTQLNTPDEMIEVDRRIAEQGGHEQVVKHNTLIEPAQPSKPWPSPSTWVARGWCTVEELSQWAGEIQLSPLQRSECGL